VGDDLGVGLAFKHIAFGLESRAQLVVVFNDAVVHQRHPAGGARRSAGAVAEVGVGVVHHGRAVRGPTGVGDAGTAGNAVGLHLLRELGHAGRAAGALQATGMHRHAAGVIAAVLQPLQALNQHGHHIAPRNPCDDATHALVRRERNKRSKCHEASPIISNTDRNNQ